MKYIDAEKLRKLLANRYEEITVPVLTDEGGLESFYRRSEIHNILKFIDSLQQGQQEEEAAEEYEKEHTYQRYDGGGLTPEYDATLAETFIAGAELQKSQMLKDAVEATVMDFSSNQPRPQIDVRLDPHKYHTGDKVRIVVLKAEKE